MDFAPIAVSTYKRVSHLRNAIDALQANSLASQSELFIFSDAPRPGDEDSVAEVRSLADRVTGFKSVQVIKRARNDRVANNREGLKFLLREFGHVIYVEEDVVVAPAFLEFMNQGLDFFQGNKSIFAVCGYTPPVDLSDSYSLNTYLCARFSAWGFGMWADRYTEIEMGEISERQLNPIQHRRLRGAGVDLLGMVQRMERHELEALDVRINFSMAKKRKLVVCPTESLAVNRGHDGTGTHCGTSDYFETKLDPRLDVKWDFRRVRRDSLVERKLFFYRGRHQMRRKNLLRYYLNRNIDFGT